jgi:hypothetical protein
VSGTSARRIDSLQRGGHAAIPPRFPPVRDGRSCVAVCSPFGAASRTGLSLPLGPRRPDREGRVAEERA